MNQFAALLFGKPLNDVTIQDIEDYFRAPQTKSDKLEFKSFPMGLSTGAIAELEKKVLRSIVGFLNSEGGVLIWGAPAGNPSTGSKETFQGVLVASNVRFEKDAFMAKIANRIIPSPRGVRFHRLETDNGRYVYLFEVPTSEYAPHQIDHIYYMRLDGQTVLAPHHYIEALFKKVTFPKLEAYLKIDGWVFENSRKHLRVQCTIIFRNLSAFQNEYDLNCRIVSSTGLVMDQGQSFLHWDPRIKEGTDFVKGKIAETIYFRNYIFYSFDIIVDRDYLAGTANRFKVLLVMGSRLAPMRQCRYVLQVGPKYPERKQNMIVEKEENLYFHETGSDDLTDQEQLEKLLNQD